MKWFIKYYNRHLDQIISVSYGSQKEKIITEIIETEDIAEYVDNLKKRNESYYAHYYDRFTGIRAYTFIGDGIDIIDIVKLN